MLSPRIRYRVSRIGVPVLVCLILAFAYWRWQWQGLAVAVSMLVMWGLLHFHRVMNVLQRAAKRPIGWVDSAVMLNARLSPGVTMLHVVAMTRALGERCSAEGIEPEVYRWADGSASHVTCEFVGGRLTVWRLERPQPESVTP